MQYRAGGLGAGRIIFRMILDYDLDYFLHSADMFVNYCSISSIANRQS